MSIKHNIIANYTGAAAIILVPMLALPWYLSLLGPEQFGLISLAITLQTLLGLIDAGISQALVREFSVRVDGSQQGLKRCAALLSSFEKIYWLLTLVLSSLVLLSVGWLESNWLLSGSTSSEVKTLTIYGSIAMFIAQFPGAIYRSLFSGTQHHVTINKIISISMLVKHLGCVVLLLIWPSLLTFFIWHTVIILLETLTRQKLAWRILLPEKRLSSWDTNEIRTIWKSVAQLSISVILGSLVIQADKVILSHMVPMTEFGYYVIAATISTGLLQIIYPLMQTVLPIASQLNNEPTKLKKLYSKLFIIITVTVCFSTLAFLMVGQVLLEKWLGSEDAAQQVYTLLSILLIGTGLNAFYNIGYVNWLVKQRTNNILRINIISLLVAVICTPFLIQMYGTSGAAFGWILISVVGLIHSLEWVRYS